MHERAAISAAVCLALYGGAYPARAADTDSQTNTLPDIPEIVVTASRREVKLEDVPFSITAISADELASTGVTDIASLTSQVPGLSMYDLGARYSGATTPIIRGLNASAISNGFRTFEQSPVGTYIGNSPIDGYFQLDDIQRVEVLRGPQGTLYGAGALGGALRIIPNDPQLDKFGANLEVGAGTLAHSSGTSYTTSGMLNIPIGDTLAFRASGKYASEPGFINVYGILQRTGSPVGGIPVLANPGDPVDSPGIFTGKSDWNDQNTFTGRASLLWKPADTFNAELAFMYAHVNGDGGPVTNPEFLGGSYPLDPRITFPKGGEYQDFSATDQPFSRRTSLTSLDLSYNTGFATLSSTSSYYTTNGSTVIDQTYGVIGVNATIHGFAQYYAGNPINPRYVNPWAFDDSAHTFTQEVRLVSNAGPDNRFDYVVGLFYENQQRDGSWTVSDPGSDKRSVAQGCTAPYYYDYSAGSPAGYPNCLVILGPNSENFAQFDAQHFTDKSEFGEFTWHFTSLGQITLGGRHFDQTFTDEQSYLLYTFGILLPDHGNSAPASKNTWKVNISYEYATNQHTYALWSQGFRRGGANAFPPAGLFQENQTLLLYRPDSVNNYELGLKGHFASGVTYAVDVFDDIWTNPQIAGSLPDGNVGVWNGTKAQSKGLEFDLSSPLFLPGLSITVGGAYADAKFTQDYFYAADNYGNIFGKAGEQLPGSPKVSAAATIHYEHQIVPSYRMVMSLNDTYRSGMPTSTFPGFGGSTPPAVSGMDIVNLSAVVNHGSWRLGAYVTNLTDKRVILDPSFPNPGNAYVDNLSWQDTINRPREIQLRVGYSY